MFHYAVDLLNKNKNIFFFFPLFICLNKDSTFPAIVTYFFPLDFPGLPVGFDDLADLPDGFPVVFAPDLKAGLPVGFAAGLPPGLPVVFTAGLPVGLPVGFPVGLAPLGAGFPVLEAAFAISATAFACFAVGLAPLAPLAPLAWAGAGLAALAEVESLEMLDFD